MAAISQEIGYANGNLASREYMVEAFRNDSAIYPSEENMDKLRPFQTWTPAYSRELNRTWTQTKSGQ
jgi:spermidine/putrescine-binding protein